MNSDTVLLFNDPVIFKKVFLCFDCFYPHVLFCYCYKPKTNKKKAFSTFLSPRPTLLSSWKCDRIERGVLQTEPFPNRRFEMVIFLCDSLGSTWKRTPRQDLTGPILKINACGKTFGYTQIHITRGITQPAWKLFYGVLCGAEKL